MHPPVTILITRPQPDADTLAEILEKRGAKCLVSPMLHVAFDDKSIKKLASAPNHKHYTSIIFTSCNGVRSTQNIPSLFSLPCICVGSKTAETARSTGFTKITHSDGDMEDLYQHIIKYVYPSKETLLYVSGTHTSGDLAKKLSSETYNIDEVKTYTTFQTTSFSEETITALETQHINAALFYSKRTAQAFLAAITAHHYEHLLPTIEAICLSQTIADTMSDLPWKQLHYASSPNNEAMLEIISKLGFINNSSAL